MAAAAPGEAIGVCPGTYPEVVTIDKAGIVLQGVGLAKVVNPGAAVNGIIVDADNVTVQALDVSGFTAFDSAATAGARSLRFTPARRDGERISVWAEVPVYFSKRPRPDSLIVPTPSGGG